MTPIITQITRHNSIIMEIEDSPFLYEWKTAEEDLEFLDYTYCFQVDNPNNTSALKPSISQSNVGDEKQTVLNISVHKLQHIEDPESCLRKTVLIGNTLKRLRSRECSGDNFKLVQRDNKEKAASCFACTLPNKRARLHVADILNSNTELDLCDGQGKVAKENNSCPMETSYTITSSADNSLVYRSPQHNPFIIPGGGDDTKRNCDPVKFSTLEIANVVCALET